MNEWADEILRLDQLVVEGFEEKWLRKAAEDLGRTPDQSFRSLKLIEEIFSSKGLEEVSAKVLMSPLQELHFLRSKLKGHASGDDAVKIKQKAIKDHSTYILHFRDLCSRCDASLGEIEKLLGQIAK